MIKRNALNIVIFSMILIMSAFSSACGNSSVKYVKTGSENLVDYSFNIEVTFDNSTSDGTKPNRKFSRPVFKETSALAKEINEIYLQAEKEFKDAEIEEDYSFVDVSTWYYTETSERAYEKAGIISFVSIDDWYMGGVHNSGKKGHTFDFNLGRELKINDVLLGDETQISVALENAFYEWFISERVGSEWSIEDIKKEFFSNSDIKDIKEQSGLNANFYLTEDGVRVFYHPYTIPATQNGIDILIPWTNTENVRDIHK